MNVECYAATRPQEGARISNEDAFLIAPGETPLIVLCDGAGAAVQAAKRRRLAYSNDWSMRPHLRI